MSKKIEKYIPKAMQVLNEEFPDGVIPSAYNGYISTFGVSIIQSGLLPTLALFENQQANTKEDKSYLTKIILKVLDGNGDSLLGYVLDSNRDESELKQEKQEIIDIAIAVKLSIRTFKLEKGESDE